MISAAERLRDVVALRSKPRERTNAGCLFVGLGALALAEVSKHKLQKDIAQHIKQARMSTAGLHESFGS